jgi:hypothetical protein
MYEAQEPYHPINVMNEYGTKNVWLHFTKLRNFFIDS